MSVIANTTAAAQIPTATRVVGDSRNARMLDALDDLNRKLKIGRLPAQGEALPGDQPWLSGVELSGENIREGVMAALPGAALLAGCAAVGGVTGGIMAIPSAFIAKKALDAISTRHLRNGYIGIDPDATEDAPAAPAALPDDMDDGTGVWWGQAVQDALDVRWTTITEVPKRVDGEIVRDASGSPIMTQRVDRKVSVVAMTPSASVTMYTLEAKPGFKVAALEEAGADLARDLKLHKGAKIVVDDNLGDGQIGLYVPNATRAVVPYNAFSSTLAASTARLPLAVGDSVTGEQIILDLSRLPHMIVGGETESGKSNWLIMALLGLASVRSPADVRFHLFDPKESSMPLLATLPHVLGGIPSTAQEAVPVLQKLVTLMQKRQKMWKELGLQDGNDYAETGRRMSHHVVVIEEAATLIRCKKYGSNVEALLLELANKGRAARIHLILATQYFAKSIFDSEMVANITSGICFRVDAYSSSKMVVKHTGGEKLMGDGDCLAMYKGVLAPVRCQALFMKTPEIKQEVLRIRKVWAAVTSRMRQLQLAKGAR